jgi:hypothetical protein
MTSQVVRHWGRTNQLYSDIGEEVIVKRIYEGTQSGRRVSTPRKISLENVKKDFNDDS